MTIRLSIAGARDPAAVEGLSRPVAEPALPAARRTLVGLSGNITRPSKTRALVAAAASTAADRFGVATEVYDILDVGPSLGVARCPADLDPEGRRIVGRLIEADALVIGSPTYKGSYTGLLKHLLDLLDPMALRGKPILLTATGGGERHALMVEHQLRPLFGFFMAHSLATAVFASARDFVGEQLEALPVRERLSSAIDEFAVFLGAPSGPTTRGARETALARWRNA